jgi:predicted N-acetyltransferase YhbS
MEEDDIPAVEAVLDAAFCKMREAHYGRPFLPPAFPRLMYPYRLAADRAGCLVALKDAQVAGAVFSVARGTVAWFGPLATDPAVQAQGIGRALVDACIESWQSRGVRLMGLETYGSSKFHVQLYGAFGFRPAWNGVAFSRTVGQAAWPDGVESGAEIPSVEFVYQGFDPEAEVAATRTTGVGQTLVTDGGMAICHLKDTFTAIPGTTFVPLLAARTQRAFERLLQAIESLSLQAGNQSVFVRASGSCWATYEGLSAAGYRAGRAMVRMKRGEHLDYDRPDLYYCDSWL